MEYSWRKKSIYFVAVVNGKAMPNAFNQDSIKYCEASDYPIVKKGITFDEAMNYCNDFNSKE